VPQNSGVEYIPERYKVSGQVYELLCDLQPLIGSTGQTARHVDLMKKIKNAYKALVMKPPRKLHLKD
jgi:hypothetical protein